MAVRPSPCAGAVAALLLAACGGPDALPESAGYGPNPTLPEPSRSLLPRVKIAPAVGWAEGATPVAAEGFAVVAFASGLDHPRWVYELPNGDILVAESDVPETPEEYADGGFRGWVQGLVMRRAGSGTGSADRITLLRDADGDGVAEVQSAFLENLTSPFGMVLIED